MKTAHGDPPRDLSLGSFDPAWIEGGLALRYTGLRGSRVARVVRAASLVAAALAPLASLDDHGPRAAMEAFRLPAIAVLVAAAASMIESFFQGAFRSGHYLRVDRHLTIVSEREAGYRSSGRGAARVEVDGQLVSEVLPERVVISQSVVTMTVSGVTSHKSFYHVSLVFRDLVLRVARFAENASDAKSFGKALAGVLGLPKPKRCEEPSFENSPVGMWGFAFMLVGELVAYPALCVVASELHGLDSPVWRAEVAVLAWMGLHVVMGRLARRWGQKQLTRIAVDAFRIDPSTESPSLRRR